MPSWWMTAKRPGFAQKDPFCHFVSEELSLFKASVSFLLNAFVHVCSIANQIHDWGDSKEDGHPQIGRICFRDLVATVIADALGEHAFEFVAELPVWQARCEASARNAQGAWMSGGNLLDLCLCRQSACRHLRSQPKWRHWSGDQDPTSHMCLQRAKILQRGPAAEWHGEKHPVRDEQIWWHDGLPFKER